MNSQDRSSLEIEIRTLRNLEEVRSIQELERIVWGVTETVPFHQTLTAVKNGGLILGAYNQEKLIGFQYSFPGFDGQNAYLCSHMLGIHPHYRNQKVGEKLKRAQREEAIRMGYDLITWTYDPLESVNAYLNIHKLGAVCSTYLENCYGDMADELNRGLASDRFLVEWWIKKPHVQCSSLLSFQAVEKRNEDGLPIPVAKHSYREGETLYIGIPARFQQIKQQSPELAIEWRTITREIFKSAFQDGWVICDFVRPTNSELYYYTLKKIPNGRGSIK